MKRNCWEFEGCGREPGGLNVKSKGVCPAATDSRLDGVHGGRNAGRACWVIAGTLCNGKTQGSFAQKFDSCEKCNFYLKVKKEELPYFILSSVLLAKLK